MIISAQLSFFQRVLEDSFCILCIGLPYLPVYNAHPIFQHSFQNIDLTILAGHLVKQNLRDRKNYQQVPPGFQVTGVIEWVQKSKNPKKPEKMPGPNLNTKENAKASFQAIKISRKL